MIASSSPFPERHAHSPLCPACGATSIRIRTSIEVEVDVVVHERFEEMLVRDEQLGDAMWDEDSLAVCPACEWTGTVGDLNRRALTTLAGS